MQIMNLYSISANINYANSDYNSLINCAIFALMNTVYANIKAIRLQKGLTQEDVAEQLGLAPSNYGRVERGLTELSIDRLQKISEIFEISISNILSFDKENELDFKEDAEFYYNFSKKLERQLSELIKVRDEDEEVDDQIHTDQLNEIELLKEKMKGLKDKLKSSDLMIKEKEKVIEDKDRMILILEKALSIIGDKVN